MQKMARLAVIGAMCLVGACTDLGGPPNGPALAIGRPLRSLRWAAAPKQFAFVGPVAHAGSALAPPVPSELSANQVSFWAYTDRDASILVNYLAADLTWKPYVQLSVPAGALLERPDGTAFAPVDSIAITVTLDTTAIQVELEPSGLVFSPSVPAGFQIWYGGSDPDFNGDGLVNFLDSALEQTLGLWVRQNVGDPWDPVSAVQSLLFQRFSASLLHFCGYAVDW